jgi:hypothetical protein
MKSELIYIKVLLPFTSYRSKTRDFRINSVLTIRLVLNREAASQEQPGRTKKLKNARNAEIYR